MDVPARIDAIQPTKQTPTQPSVPQFPSPKRKRTWRLRPSSCASRACCSTIFRKSRACFCCVGGGGHGIGPSQKPAIYACVCIRSEINQSIDRSVSRSDGPQARPARPGPICWWWPPPPHTADHRPGPQPGPIEPHISARAFPFLFRSPGLPACPPGPIDPPTDRSIDRHAHAHGHAARSVEQYAPSCPSPRWPPRRAPAPRGWW